jgi:RNA polymerase sigma-70 factor (ECF subfamily)
MGERPDWAAGVLGKARARWPQLTLDEEAFLAHIRASSQTARCAPETLHVEDLWLALACASRSVEAIAEFDRAYGTTIVNALRRVFKTQPDLEDANQRLRERLFVGPPPRILDYNGTGPLGGWLRVSALRNGLNDERGKRARARIERAAGEEAWHAVDPELELMRRRYEKEFDRALRFALEQLEREDRLLLRLHYIDGISLAQLSKMHRVDASTMSRRLTRVRKSALTGARTELQRQLGVSPDTAKSLMNLLESRMDISLRALRSEG